MVKDIPRPYTFTGTELFEWFETMEYYFLCNNKSEHSKIYSALICVDKKAYDWIKECCGGISKINDWQTIQEALVYKFGSLKEVCEWYGFKNAEEGDALKEEQVFDHESTKGYEEIEEPESKSKEELTETTISLEANDLIIIEQEKEEPRLEELIKVDKETCHNEMYKEEEMKGDTWILGNDSEVMESLVMLEPNQDADSLNFESDLRSEGLQISSIDIMVSLAKREKHVGGQRMTYQMLDGMILRSGKKKKKKLKCWKFKFKDMDLRRRRLEYEVGGAYETKRNEVMIWVVEFLSQMKKDVNQFQTELLIIYGSLPRPPDLRVGAVVFGSKTLDQKEVEQDWRQKGNYDVISSAICSVIGGVASMELIQMRLTDRGDPKAQRVQAGPIGSGLKKDNQYVTAASAREMFMPGSIEKLKASKFVSLLKIGQWDYKSRYEGDWVAKCYLAKYKLVWEVFQPGLKSKMENSKDNSRFVNKLGKLLKPSNGTEVHIIELENCHWPTQEMSLLLPKSWKFKFKNGVSREKVHKERRNICFICVLQIKLKFVFGSLPRPPEIIRR